MLSHVIPQAPYSQLARFGDSGSDIIASGKDSRLDVSS